MTREDALKRLIELAERSSLAYPATGDAEENHVEADDILCALLAHLGYEDIVAAYNEIFKWYA